MSSGCSYRIRTDERLGCIAVRWFGTFSAETCRRFFDELAQMPNFRKCTRLIHDGRECDLSVDSAEIFRAARLPLVEADRDAPLRIAIVVAYAVRSPFGGSVVYSGAETWTCASIRPGSR